MPEHGALLVPAWPAGPRALAGARKTGSARGRPAQALVPSRQPKQEWVLDAKVENKANLKKPGVSKRGRHASGRGKRGTEAPGVTPCHPGEVYGGSVFFPKCPRQRFSGRSGALCTLPRSLGFLLDPTLPGAAGRSSQSSAAACPEVGLGVGLELRDSAGGGATATGPQDSEPWPRWLPVRVRFLAGSGSPGSASQALADKETRCSPSPGGGYTKKSLLQSSKNRSSTYRRHNLPHVCVKYRAGG